VSHHARHISNHLVYQHGLPWLFSAGVTYGFFKGADIWPYLVLLLKFCCEEHQIYNVFAKCPSRRFSASYSKRLGSRPIVVVKHQLSNYQNEEL
jgi:hypothetical protein